MQRPKQYNPSASSTKNPTWLSSRLEAEALPTDTLPTDTLPTDTLAIDQDGQHAHSLSFEVEAPQIIRQLIQRLWQLFTELGLEKKTSPTELARALTIDLKLAWKITHLLSEEDPFQAGQFVPGKGAFNSFLRTLDERCAESTIESVRQGALGFYALVGRHANNRKSFDSLLASQTIQNSAVDVEQRKSAFLANAHILGVRSAVQLKTYILAPSQSRSDMFDAAIVAGSIGLTRLRSQSPWRITRGYSVNDTGEYKDEFVREALLKSRPLLGQELPLLEDYCSRPLPVCQASPGSLGTIDYLLAEGPVGNAAAIDCLYGEVIRQAEPRFSRKNYKQLVMHARVRTPAEVLNFDVMLHHSLFKNPSPCTEIFSDLHSGETIQFNSNDLLPISLDLEHRPHCKRIPRCPHFARYGHLIEDTFLKLGWKRQDFGFYRLQVKYPPLPSATLIFNPLDNA